MESKNKTMKQHIDRYFLMLEHKKREVNENILSELIQQWAFDYQMDKDLNRFDEE